MYLLYSFFKDTKFMKLKNNQQHAPNTQLLKMLIVSSIGKDVNARASCLWLVREVSTVALAYSLSISHQVVP